MVMKETLTLDININIKTPNTKNIVERTEETFPSDW